MVWLIFWLLCGAVCAMIAKEKNLSVPMWLLMGCLFGVFALIAVFFVDSEAPNDAE